MKMRVKFCCEILSNAHRFAVMLGLITAVGFAQASDAAVLTFDALGSNGPSNIFFGPTISEDGFTFSNLDNSGPEAFFVPQNNNTGRPFGQPTLGNSDINGTTRLVTDSGNPFSLSSIDVSEVNDDGSGAVSVTFVGTFLDLSTISQTVTTDGVFGLETFFLTGFNSITKLEWVQASPFHTFDNVVVNEISPVPLPAALPLFLSVLAGMGFLRWWKRRVA